MSPPTPSSRSDLLPPFGVMSLLSIASSLPPHPLPLLHLEIGQPTLPPLSSALHHMTHSLSLPPSLLGYSSSTGLSALQQALSAHYMHYYSLSLLSSEFLVSAGASAMLTPLFITLFDPKDRVALTVPGYPPYAHILRACGVDVVGIRVGEEEGWNLNVELLKNAHEDKELKGVLIGNPSNPTGGIVKDLDEMAKYCESEGIWLIVDEIYHGVGTGFLPTAAKFEKTVTVSSMSKLWRMPGFRIGWAIIRDKDVRTRVENALRSMTLAASTPGQHAAVGALRAEWRDEVESDGRLYGEIRERVKQRLKEGGFEVAGGEGGWYVWIGCKEVCKQLGLKDGEALVRRWLEEIRVIVAHGEEFDEERGKYWVRVSCADLDGAVEGVERIVEWIGAEERRRKGEGNDKQVDVLAEVAEVEEEDVLAEVKEVEEMEELVEVTEIDDGDDAQN